MAKTYSYKITLYPAGYDRGFLTHSFEFTKSYPARTVKAAGMPDLKIKVRAFAEEHGESCFAYVKCLAHRNPPGFKKATEDHYYNMKGIVPEATLERLTAATA